MLEREERDEELRQVAERGLHDTRRRGADAPAELLGRAADEAREERDRRGGDEERQHGRRVEVVRRSRAGDEHTRRCANWRRSRRLTAA